MTADDFGAKQNAIFDVWHQHSSGYNQPMGNVQPASRMSPHIEFAANKYKDELVEITNACKQKG